MHGFIFATEKGDVMLTVKNLSTGYNGEDVIHNININAERGESLCLLGPNGCGKTTVLKSIARLIEYRGCVTLNDTDITTLSRKELAKKIAILGQSSPVFFPYTVYETVSMGRYAWAEGFLKSLSAIDKEIIENILNRLDITGIRGRMIDELSGGQLQRVFLARALVQNPEVILLDEPTNHLDLKYQIELLEFLKSWVKENNKTLISVFHDLNLARRFGDTVLLMNNGITAAYGKVEEALNREKLREVYGIDIHGFMLESLGKWG